MEIKLFKNKKFVKGGLLVKPDLYWKYIIFCTIAFVLLAFTFGWNLFNRVSKESMLPAVGIEEKEVVKKEKIDLLLKYYYDREQKSKSIINTPSPVSDPSI